MIRHCRLFRNVRLLCGAIRYEVPYLIARLIEEQRQRVEPSVYEDSDIKFVEDEDEELPPRL